MRPLLALPLLVAPTVAAAQDLEEPAQFPDAPGREETFHACIACRTIKLVAAQGMTRERWAATLVRMTERHATQPLDPQDEGVVLDYLSTAFGPKAAGAGWRNPFAQRYAWRRRGLGRAQHATPRQATTRPSSEASRRPPLIAIVLISLERAMRFELTTPTLARLCSTTELRPRRQPWRYSDSQSLRNGPAPRSRGLRQPLGSR